MEQIVIEGIKRENIGSKFAKLERRENRVPCVIYGGEETISFTAPFNSFRNLVYSDQFHKVHIKIDGKDHQAIVKSIQFHPTKDTIEHVDFQEMLDGKPIIVKIPLRTTGFARGLQEGGSLQMRIRKLTVKALPKNIPNEHIIDVTDVGLGDSIKVKDLSINNVEIINSESLPVLSIVIPRLARQAMQEEEEAAAAAAAEAEAAEGGDAAPAAEGGDAAPAAEGGDEGGE